MFTGLSEREIKIHIDVLSKEEEFVDKARLLSNFEREHIKQYIRSRIGRLQMDADEKWHKQTSRSEYDRISENGQVKYVMRGH